MLVVPSGVASPTWVLTPAAPDRATPTWRRQRRGQTQARGAGAPSTAHLLPGDALTPPQNTPRCGVGGGGGGGRAWHVKRKAAAAPAG
ncbi:hypothetical protein O3P69_001151 [Scylla paramamosain]|uniref:Uncharacterized protein n=1 Tax=Scylla paramamosain TaxID=85552 RepID=A0AAW0UT53_SCYPA